MTKVTFPTPQGVFMPAWPPDIVRQSPTSFGGIALDAANEFVDFIGQVGGAPYTGSKTVEAVQWRSHLSNASGHTIRISLQERDSGSAPPPRGDGVEDQYADVVAPAASTAYETLLDSGSAKSLAYGDWIVVRFKMTAVTSGQYNIAAIPGVANTGYHEHFTTYYNGSSYASQHFYGIVNLKFDDDSVAILHPQLPRFSGATTEGFTNETAGSGLATGPRRALKWTPSSTYYCIGGHVLVYPTTYASFDINIYEGTTKIASCSYQDAYFMARDERWFPFYFGSEVTLSSGSTYYLAVVPTTVNDVYVFTHDVTDRTHLDAIAPEFSYDCWGSTDWQNPTDSNLRIMQASFRITGMEVSGSETVVSGSTTVTSAVVNRNTFFI